MCRFTNSDGCIELRREGILLLRSVVRKFQLHSATAAWCDSASGLAAADRLDCARIAATGVLLEQLLEDTAEQWLVAGSWLATANWFHNCTTTIDWSDFATTGWFANGSNVTAGSRITAAVLIEQLLEQATKLGTWVAAWIHHFATTHRLCNFIATAGLTNGSRIATTVTQTIKQAESGICRVASDNTDGQQRRDDHTTHR